MPVNPIPIETPSAIDLTTAAYVSQVLAAGGVTLTSAQAGILSSLITAASREIIRFCGRKFGLQTYTEIVTPEGTRQDRGEPASAKLSAFPVQSVTSVLTGRASVLTVRNLDAANQFAQVAFSTTGDVEYLDLTNTGIVLTRTASGVVSSDTMAFASNPTLQDLANSINAVGGGWNATVQAAYEPYPSASLVGVREPKDARSNGACLDLFTQPATSYDAERSTGIMRFYGWNGWFGSSMWGFGGYGTDWDGTGGYGGGAWGWGQYQVTYQAGFATIPANLQLIAAEVVKGTLARLAIDPAIKSESADKYSWAARDSLANLSDDMKLALNYYKDWQV